MLMSSCVHVCMLIMCVPGTCGDQKRVNLLELDLWTVVSRHVSARD